MDIRYPVVESVMDISFNYFPPTTYQNAKTKSYISNSHGRIPFRGVCECRKPEGTK